MRCRCATISVTGSVASILLALTFLNACGSSSPRPPTQPAPVVQQPPVEPVPPPPPPPTLSKTRILAFGDSMTEGIDSPAVPFDRQAWAWTLPADAGRPQSYPFKLKALMDGRYGGQVVVVLNGGLAGRQARDDRSRFTEAVSDARPDLILLMEGANDLNSPLAPGEGINARVDSVVGALEDFVRDAGFRNIPVLIATLPPQRPDGPKAGGLEYLPRFNNALRVMAGKKGAEVVEVATLPVSLIGQDGLHPSEAGYVRIAEIWFDAIRTRYERLPQ